VNEEKTLGGVDALSNGEKTRGKVASVGRISVANAVHESSDIGRIALGAFAL
jgi:hypothetical protein